MLRSETVDDYSDVEAALKKLRPVGPSERFYVSVESALGGAEEDFSDVEEALKKLQPVGLSDRFYASVAGALDEESEDFSDVEGALKKLRPVGLSDRFYASVEAELGADGRGNDGNTVAFSFPPRRNGLLRFPFARIAASAAVLLCAVGLGVWGFFASPERSPGLPGTPMNQGVAFDSVSSQAAAAAVAAVGSNLAVLPKKKRRSGGDFRLVNTERRLNSVKPMNVVAKEDGSLSREVRYTYMDEYRWEDKESGSAFVELRPHEELVSMEMSIY